MREAVLLDVDGTLIDDNLLHVLAWTRAFRRLGRTVDASAVLHALGMGGDRLVPAILGEVDDATAERARSLHAEEYVHKRLIEHAEALPGAVELLRALRARGAATALASSARPEELARYLPALEGATFVDAIVTAQDVSTTKPAPDLFAVALSRLGDPARTIVVGDTVYDVEAAGKLGLACVCLLTGGIARGTLLAAGAAAIYDDPHALAQDLDGALALRLDVLRV
jgi:HAD superfamily hydrolase (TIGR01509 family)